MKARQCVWLNRAQPRVLKGRDFQVELFGRALQVELLRAVRKSSSGRLL